MNFAEKQKIDSNFGEKITTNNNNNLNFLEKMKYYNKNYDLEKPKEQDKINNISQFEKMKIK